MIVAIATVIPVQSMIILDQSFSYWQMAFPPYVVRDSIRRILCIQ